MEVALSVKVPRLALRRVANCVERDVGREESKDRLLRIATVLDGRRPAGESRFAMDRFLAPSPSLIA